MLKKKPPEKPTPKLSMEDMIKKKRDDIVAARDQARLQLNGLENQLYVLDQLLNPQPEPEILPDAKEVPEDPPPNGVDMEKGTI